MGVRYGGWRRSDSEEMRVPQVSLLRHGIPKARKWLLLSNPRESKMTFFA